MDPITALGAAAASAQFLGYAVKGLLGAAKLFKAIKDSPEESLRLLAHVDKEVASINRLVSSSSSVFPHLSIEQYALLSKHALDARKGLENIQRIIEPLATKLKELQGEDGPLKKVLRTWKAILTADAMKTIQADLSMVAMLNASLLRELLLVDLEMQSLLIDQSNQTLTLLSSLPGLSNDVKQLIQETSARQLQAIGTISLATTSLEQGFDKLRMDLNNNNSGQSKILSSMSTELATTRNDVSTVLRNQDSSHLLLERVEATASNQSLVLSSILHAQKEDMKEFICMQSKSDHTTLLEEIRNELHANLKAQTPYRQQHQDHDLELGKSRFEVDISTKTASLSYSFRRKFMNCRCHQRTPVQDFRISFLGFRSERQLTEHCPLHGKIRSWNYSIMVQLSPWLNSALEFNLGVLSGRQGWSLLSPLRAQTMVQRSQSPLFRSFDRITSVYQDPQYVLSRDYWVRGSILGQDAKRNFERKLQNEVSVLIHEVEKAVSLGQASGTDEYRSTLLTEIIRLLFLLDDNVAKFSVELTRLFHLANTLRVDPMVQMHTVWNAFPSTSRRFVMLISDDAPVAFGLHQFFLQRGSVDMRLYQALMQYDGLAESVGTYRKPREINPRRIWASVLAFPDLAEALEWTDLALAIARRSFADLVRCFRDPTQVDVTLPTYEQTPMALAVGWYEGLQFLVDQGCNITEAFDEACRKKDVDSAMILLSTKQTLFRGYDFTLCIDGFLYVWGLSDSVFFSPIFLIFCQELWNRQDEVRTIVRARLEAHEREGYTCDRTCGDTCPFANASTRSAITENIDAFISTSHHSHSFLNADQHQALYDIGFKEFSFSPGLSLTPFALLCRSAIPQLRTGDWYSRWIGRVLWFLGRGTDSNLDGANNKPTRELQWLHLPFYLACAMDYTGRLSQRATLKCTQELIHDGCRCRCSQEGCIPPSILWRDKERYRSSYHWECEERLARRSHSLALWARRWKYSRLQREFLYRHICRLELFERLGMTHSCCANAKHDYRGRPKLCEDFGGDDGLLEEEEICSKQLVLMVQVYRRLRAALFRTPLPRFWAAWWNVADKIVLPLLPEEACRKPYHWVTGEWNHDEDKERNLRQRIAQHREERWEDLLKSTGYGGWEFDDVIRHHFAKMSQFVKAHRERERSWKQHRLVGRPRLITSRYWKEDIELSRGELDWSTDSDEDDQGGMDEEAAWATDSDDG